MLERLRVRGLGIIAEVEVEFHPGFTALTGETGAGKSLVVEGLNLVAGGRASADMVRSGDDRLVVEAWFAPADGGGTETVLADLGVPSQEGLVVRREVTSAGRSRCWINDTAVSVGALERLGRTLLAVHGQHEQYGLADPETQLGIVDDFAALEKDRCALAETWESWARARAEVDRLEGARDRRRDRLDTITYQEAAIDGVAPEVGEDENLRQRRLQLRHAARLRELSDFVVDGLGEGEGAVIDVLARIQRSLAEMAEFGLGDGEGERNIGEARVLCEEVLREVDLHRGSLAADPEELERVENRLHHLEGLALKYGGSIDAVLEHRQRLAEERRELEGVEDRLGEARAGAEAALETYDQAARRIHEARVEAGRTLVGDISSVLASLDMKGTKLEFSWSARPAEHSQLFRDGQPVSFDGNGVEKPDLMLAANPGEELRPMARIASGGELSRIHLGIRSVLRRVQPAGGLTLLFDEVDTGLGGRTAAALAGLLADLGRDDQVLVVTHLAQVASRADHQFRVAKIVDAGRTLTVVSELGTDDRIEEVARMLAGQRITTSARTHAAELLAAGDHKQ